MKKESDRALREHLIYLLTDGGAHAKFDDTIAAIPAKLRGQKPSGMPHSPWMLLEHMRIAQRDIIEFSRNPKYKSPLGQRVTGRPPKLRPPPQLGMKVSKTSAKT